jgi:hypothetical protein
MSAVEQMLFWVKLWKVQRQMTQKHRRSQVPPSNSELLKTSLCLSKKTLNEIHHVPRANSNSAGDWGRQSDDRVVNEASCYRQSSDGKEQRNRLTGSNCSSSLCCA